MRKHAGFSLIEILIVVAIMSILATIAIPYYREAQIRAKVARAKADLQTLNTAMEAYGTDTGSYPRGNWTQLATLSVASGNDRSLVLLSTPVSYISQALLDDPFPTHRRYTTTPGMTIQDTDHMERVWLKFSARREGANVGTRGTPDFDPSEQNTEWYILQSSGPDSTRFIVEHGPIGASQITHFMNTFYDPSNGTFSSGSIYRAGGLPLGAEANLFRAITLANQ